VVLLTLKKGSNFKNVIPAPNAISQRKSRERRDP